MVVIGRNRFVFTKLQEVLSVNNIPYALRKGERQGESISFFGKVLDYAIRVKLNPKDWVNGKKLCVLLSTEVPEQWGDFKQLNIWSKAVQRNNIVFPELQSKLLSSIYNLDEEDPNIPKFTQTFKQELMILADSCTDENLKLEIEMSIKELNDFNSSWILFRKKGLGDSLQGFRNAMALGKLSHDSNTNGLTLSTVHTMKGLEKDIVFLMGMCEGVFPDYRANTHKKLDEERNNAFVAVTRARRWLYISYPKQRLMPWGDIKFQKQSRFILEMKT